MNDTTTHIRALVVTAVLCRLQCAELLHVFRISPLVIPMLLPALSKNLHLRSIVSREAQRSMETNGVCDCSAASRRPRFNIREQLRHFDLPQLCTLASLFSHSSNLSTWHSHLQKISSVLRLIPSSAPAQPVLKILLSLYVHQLPQYKSHTINWAHQSSGSSSTIICAAAACALVSFDILEGLGIERRCLL